MNENYVIRPKADQDLADQAYYLATEAGPELGHRFLLSSHETFSHLAANPAMGWAARTKHPDLAGLRVFSVSGFEKMLVFYRPQEKGVEIIRVFHGSRNLNRLFRREGI